MAAAMTPGSPGSPRRGRSLGGPASFEADGFRAAVLAWYDAAGRTFPFRGLADPYLVLVSEVILQQTQVSRGAPAWEAFTARFPTVESLAAASPAEVLRAWVGLGYNRRALNLQRAARTIVGQLGGRFPTDVAGLERLPGVGPYTARAVASIAFGAPVGAVDTNVRRVIGRVVAGQVDALPARQLQAIADALVPEARPADWTHALMDLGSTRCRPRAPRCGECPARPWCRHATAGDGAPPEPAAGRLRAAREPPAAYEATSRWLRGRILDRLREADGDGWTRLPAAIGTHDARAIGRALAGLADEGLLELEGVPAPDDVVPRARLPLA